MAGGASSSWRPGARERAVRIGKINAEYGEVVSGLAEGNRVILNPGNGIEDVGRVRPR
jgi:hypothetical protein